MTQERTMITEPLREEHRRLLPHVQQLRELADAVGDTPGSALLEGVERAHAFITQHLLPHAEAEDRVLYPAVARLMGAPEATRTMSRDHLAIFRLGDELDTLRSELQGKEPTDAQLRSLRRVLYGLHAVVKLHFAKEEELYLPILETQLGPREMSELLRAMQATDAQAGHPARPAAPTP
jgi:iron-sulfur cluster repair protein YtfE (RIC family)